MSFPGEGLASAAVSAGMSFYGAERANSANKRMAREQMAFQKDSAQTQMDFQERMSNTSYQRTMEDMKKAGLNPILAYNQGGASSPGGAMGSGASAQMTNSLAGAVSSAMEARRNSAEVANMKEQNKVLTTQADLNKTLNDTSKSQEVFNIASANEKVANTAKIRSETIRGWVDTVADVGKNALIFLSRMGKLKGF